MTSPALIGLRRLLHIFLSGILLWMAVAACEHEPIVGPLPPTDTTDTTGGNGGGNGGGGALPPCDEDSVYFEAQLLPILVANCAKSGCHDANTAQSGVILNSYSNVMNTADVRPFDPESSDLYELITEDDPDKRMPPASEEPLTAEQIALIRKWIEQGAQDLQCEEEPASCNTASVSFSQTLQPIFQRSCVGCHGSSQANAGIRLNNHENVVKAVETGRLLGAIRRESGFSPMPQGSNKLPDCEIAQIEAWISQGMLNN